jgi:FlaA1/EpsC-like NDP-sugar epimerase
MIPWGWVDNVLAALLNFLAYFFSLSLYTRIFRYFGRAILLTMSRVIFIYASLFFIIVAIYGVAEISRGNWFLQ